MNNNSHVFINLDNKQGNGEDFWLNQDYEKTTVIAVFDGLGGRTLGTAGETGGRIASRESSKSTEKILQQSQGNLNSAEEAEKIQKEICQVLKKFAEENLPVSRMRGKLVNKRLCSTIALASICKPLTNEGKYQVQIAWMGDSRIYYLNPTQGLQQLTKDDLQESKDALEVIYQDPPMSQFLTANSEENWLINYRQFELAEKGFILACTDGCFQYLPAPWEFEKLLLTTLIKANSFSEWKNLLTEFYQKNKHDDITLLLYPLENDDNNFQDFHSQYQSRSQHLRENYDTKNKSSRDELTQMWNQYRNDYEFWLEKEQQKQQKADLEDKPIGKQSNSESKTESKKQSQEKSETVSSQHKEENYSNENVAKKVENGAIKMESGIIPSKEKEKKSKGSSIFDKMKLPKEKEKQESVGKNPKEDEKNSEGIDFNSA